MTRNTFHLTATQILNWADAFQQRHGLWPTPLVGPVGPNIPYTWEEVDGALRESLADLSNSVSLAGLLAEERGVPLSRKPPLTIEDVLRWADNHFRRTGAWPVRDTGSVLEAPEESWGGINNALKTGSRGMPVGSSLARLLQKYRGVRNSKDLPRLNEAIILGWADGYFQRRGDWPTQGSGPIEEAPGETWPAIDGALREGKRGLPGQSSLAQLLDQRRGVRNKLRPPLLTIEQVLEWIDMHRERTGKWPSYSDGPILEAPGETWHMIEGALQAGRRGLPGGSSLAQFLQEQREVRNPSKLPHLTERQIWLWAKAHHQRTGTWPHTASGLVEEAPGETWANLNGALGCGRRGLKSRSSLALVIKKYGGICTQRKWLLLTEDGILEWCDAHHRREGKWPNVNSGAVEGTVDENWRALNDALILQRYAGPEVLVATELASNGPVRAK